MAERITSKKLAKNVILSVSVQIISLAVSFLMNLVVPKFIDGYQYAYWQTYILYTAYVGVLHFGLLDGIVLRYSGYDYDELDKPRLRSQFITLLVFTSLVFALMTGISFICTDDVVGRTIIIFIAAAVISKNISTYTSYSFQITNRINRYAVVVLTQRLAYGAASMVFLLIGLRDFYWFCLADIIGDAASIVVGMCLNRGLYLGRTIGLRDVSKEIKANLSSGILLLLANWSSILVLSGGRLMVQWNWDELIFGQVSFSFSVTNLFLTFVTAISVVLFPALKRMDEQTLPSLYIKLRNVVSLLLVCVLILYFPGCFILELWLPAYADSLRYLGILLPLVIFSAKVTLLTNNYLKVYRREKAMMLINVISITVGMGLFSLFSFAFHSLIGLLVSIVVVVTGNSIASEAMVMHIIGRKALLPFIEEAVMAVAFILCTQLLDLWIGMGVYAACIVIYCVINHKEFGVLFGRFRKHNQAMDVGSESDVSDITDDERKEE